ncbi:MAG: LysR family transcriptional regulator [Rhodospirillaceae bacterium]|nr:LysR family transcriptional regulator [Rhodospirillaceae bacterium]
MKWDDLRFFLAIARAGSLTAAPAELRVSQPTVSRRLAAMEARLGVRLFDRTRSGYELTAPGLEIFETVERVEGELGAVERQLSGKERRLTGSLRLTCTELMANLYRGPHLRSFLDHHPGIDLSVLCTFQHLNLSRREADVAVRISSSPPETLVGRRLTTTAVGVYAASDRAGQLRAMPCRNGWEWIGWQDESYSRMMITGPFPGATIRHRSDDTQAMRSMARHGMGIATLPCYVGDSDPSLRRIIDDPVPGLSPDMWVLSHPGVRRVARIRHFAEFMADTIIADRDLFEGKRPRG